MQFYVNTIIFPIWPRGQPISQSNTRKLHRAHWFRLTSTTTMTSWQTNMFGRLSKKHRKNQRFGGGAMRRRKRYSRYRTGLFPSNCPPQIFRNDWGTGLTRIGHPSKCQVVYMRVALSLILYSPTLNYNRYQRDIGPPKTYHQLRSFRRPFAPQLSLALPPRWQDANTLKPF
jgi:hypothetical protein